MTAVAYSDKFTSSREQSATALGEKWEALVCWPHALRDSSEQQSSCGCCGRRAHLFDEAGVVCGQHLNAILGSGGKKKGGCRRRATCRRRHPSPETVWRALAEFDGEQQSEGGERPSFAPSMSTTTTTTTALDHRTKSGVGGAGPRSTATSVAAHEGEVDASGSGGSSISSSFGGVRCTVPASVVVARLERHRGRSVYVDRFLREPFLDEMLADPRLRRLLANSRSRVKEVRCNKSEEERR